MIAERTGTLAGIKRHDYLPFGEEIMAGLAGRTTQQGYVSDNVRQQFTGQERDDETGLDYFNARYHSSMQGRFTSVDPLMASAHATNPQSWNRYSYTLNNPLRYVDPTGMRMTPPSAGGTAEDVDREEYELTGGTEQQQKEKIPKKGYYVDYRVGKEVDFNGEKAKGVGAGKPLFGSVRTNSVVVYKDGKPVTKGDVTVEERVEILSVTVKDENGNRVAAPQDMVDELNKGSLTTEGKEQAAYDNKTGQRPIDRQGILQTSKEKFESYKKQDMTSVDRVTFTVRDNAGATVAVRSITSVKTVTSVNITKGPNIRY